MKLYIADNGWQRLYVVAASHFRAKFNAERKFRSDGSVTVHKVRLHELLDLTGGQEQTTDPLDIDEFNNIFDRS